MKKNILFSIFIVCSMMHAQTVFHPSITQHNKVTVVFAHGIVDYEGQAYDYFKQSFPNHIKKFPTSTRYLFDLEIESLVSVQFNDAGLGITKFIKARLSTLGQGLEIECIKNAYDQYNLKDHEAVIFCGPSRGPAAIINFIAKYNPENAAALILENPYDSVEGCIKVRSLPEPIKRLLYWFVCTVFKYRHDGEHPIEQIKNIKNKNLPIIIICSEQDNIVHWKSSENLYKAFITNGFTNVTFVKAKLGKHAKILWGPEGDRYQKIVHALRGTI